MHYTSLKLCGVALAAGFLATALPAKAEVVKKVCEYNLVANVISPSGVPSAQLVGARVQSEGSFAFSLASGSPNSGENNRKRTEAERSAAQRAAGFAKSCFDALATASSGTPSACRPNVSARRRGGMKAFSVSNYDHAINKSVCDLALNAKQHRASFQPRALAIRANRVDCAHGFNRESALQHDIGPVRQNVVCANTQTSPQPIEIRRSKSKSVNAIVAEANSYCQRTHGAGTHHMFQEWRANSNGLSATYICRWVEPVYD